MSLLFNMLYRLIIAFLPRSKALLCSKFSKTGFNSMGTINFQRFNLILEKAVEPEIKLPTSIWSSKKQESSRKTSTSTLLTLQKPLIVCIITNCGKFLKRWEYQTTWPDSWEICMQVKKQQLELSQHGTDWFQNRKGVCQGCIFWPCLFNSYAEYIMQNTGLDKAQAGVKIAGRNINNLRYVDDTTLMAKWRRTEEPLEKSEGRKWKSWFKTQHS